MECVHAGQSQDTCNLNIVDAAWCPPLCRLHPRRPARVSANACNICVAACVWLQGHGSVAACMRLLGRLPDHVYVSHNHTDHAGRGNGPGMGMHAVWQMHDAKVVNPKSLSCYVRRCPAHQLCATLKKLMCPRLTAEYSCRRRAANNLCDISSQPATASAGPQHRAADFSSACEQRVSNVYIKSGQSPHAH